MITNWFILMLQNFWIEFALWALHKHTNSICDSKSIKWSIIDYISPAMRSWWESPAAFIAFNMNVFISLPHIIAKVCEDCKNLICSKMPYSARLSIPRHISGVPLTPQPQHSYFCKRNILPISVLSFLTGAICWMNSRSTKVHVRKREAERKWGWIQKKNLPH